MDLPRPLAVKVKKTARKSGPRCLDIPRKQLAGTKQFEANLSDIDIDLASLEQAETAIPIPRQTKTHSSSFDYPNGLEHVRGSNPVSTPTDKILLSPSSTVSTFETVKSLSGACSGVVERWSSHSVFNTVPFIAKTTADSLSDQEQTLVSPCHVADIAYELVPLPFQKEDLGDELAPRYTSEIENVGKLNSPPVLTPIHSSGICSEGKRDTPPVLTPNTASENGIVARKHLPTDGGVTVVSTADSFLVEHVEREQLSCLNADCPSSPPPVERKLFSHLNSDSPASPTRVERNLFSHMSVDSPSSPPPSERTSSAQLQYLPPERKLFSHLKDDLSPMPPERKLFSHLKDEVSSLPPERKLFSHLKDDLQTLPVPISPERKLFAHLNVDSPASPEESDGEEKRSVHSYANDIELKRVRVLRARSPDIPDSPEDNTLNGSSVSVGYVEEAKSAAYGSDFQARLGEEDKCRSRLYENETSPHDKGASSSLVKGATGVRKTQDQGSCDTAVVNTDPGATEEGLKDSTLNQRSDQTAPVSKEILSLELSDPNALASSQENVAPNTCSISSVAPAPVSSVRSSQVSVSRKETKLSTSAGIMSISTGSRVNSARDPRKNIPSRAPTLSFLNDQVIRGHPSPNIPQGKVKPNMDSEVINTSSSSRNLEEHIWYPSPNVYPEVNFEYNLHGATSGPYYDYSSPHHQYSGIPSHFNMCDAQGNVYGFYTGYDVQGHLTAYPDPAYCHPQVDPAEMFYCDSLGNILQDQRGPSVNSSHWDESSMDIVNDVLLETPLDRYISGESHKAPHTTPSESVGVSSTIRNIVSSVRSVSEKNFGLSCGPKSSTGLVTRAPDDSARKPEPIEKVTNEGIAKSNAVDRQSVLGRSYAQNHDKARHTWPANLSRPRTDKGIKETRLKPQHKRQFIDSKCLSQKVCDQKHTVGIKHSGSIPSGSDPPNNLNQKGEELLSALENVQNKILNQIDRTAKTMAKASVDQRKKSDSEHGPKQSQYRIPKRSSADAPKHKNIKSGGSKAAKPVMSQKLEGKVVEKKLLEELRQKEKKLAEVMQEKAKLLAAKIEMDKEKYSPKLQAGKMSNEEQEKSDAGKSKIAGARMKMPLSFQQLFGNSLNYQGGTDQKAKKPASITSRRSKSTDSTDKGKAVSIGKRRSTADSPENADIINGGDTKASPIILDESSNTSRKSQGEKKAGAVVERRRSSNSTSSVSSAKSSQSHDSGKSHRSSSGGVSLADSTHRLKDGDKNSHKTKHRHSSSSNRNHGHGVKVHGHSSKYKSKETILEHASRGHIHSKPGRDNEGAGHPLRSDDVLEKVKPQVETKGKKDDKEPRKVVTVDPSKEPGKGKTLNIINKRSEDDFKGSVNSKKLGDQFKGLQSGQPKKDSIPAQILKHSVEQKKARLKGCEFPPHSAKVGSNYEENVSKIVDEEVSTEVQYAYEVHKTMTDCTVRLCKMPTPKTPVNLTAEVIRRCSPCEYSSVLISKLDKKTRLQGVQVEVSRKLMNSKTKTDRLKDGLKLQQVGLSSSSDDDVPLNALLDKLRTPKKVKKLKRKKSVECSMKSTAIDLEKEVKNPTSPDGKIFQDKLNERRLVSRSDVHVSTAVEPKKANADNSERGRGRPASDQISKKRKKPDSDWTFKENKKRDSDGTGMENRKSYISCESKKFGLDKTSMTCKESQKHDLVGTCQERDSPDYNIACRKPDSDSICEERKQPVPNLTCKDSREPDPEDRTCKERGNSSNSVLTCKEPVPHSTCEESGKPYSDLRYKESERPGSYSTRTEDKKPGSDSSCKKSEQPGLDSTCKESNELGSDSSGKERAKLGSDSSGNESKKSDPNSSCLESEKLDCGNFDAGLAVLNKKSEINAERVVLETDKEMFGKDATLDANGNVVSPESCGIAMHNLGEAIEDRGVVIKDTCLDTTDSSELSLGVSCCMEIMQRDDIVKEKGITTGACDEVVPLTPVSSSLGDQPAVANMFNRDPGENPSVEVLGTPACEESITRIYGGLLPDDVKVVPEKELLRDVDEPKATAICTETEVFVGPRSCPAYDQGAASGMKDLIGHMVSEIVRATKENRRKKDTLSHVNESIKAECQTSSVSNDSNDVLNRTSNTLNTTSSEDRTILYGDSSYDFENNSLCGSQGMFSASPEDEDEETHKLLPSRKDSDYCQPDSRSESTLSADDFNIQLTPSTNPSSPRDRNSTEFLTDEGGTYLPDLRNVSPVHFDGDSMESFPGPEAVMSPNSFKDACSNIVGSARKRSVSFALTKAARNSAARKTARFHWTSSPADKTTLVSKLAIPACKLDEQKSSENAMKLGDAYIPSIDGDTDRLDKGRVFECSEYRTASVAVAMPVCVEADQRLDVSTLDKAVESFEGGNLKESSDSRGDDTRSELVKISGVDATEDKTFEIGTKWKADEASGDGPGTTTKIKITSEEAAIRRKYSAGHSEELVTEPPALGLPEAVDRTQGPDPYSADMQSTASKAARTQSKDIIAADTSQDKTSSDADIQKNSPTLKIHVRSVKRDMRIMVDIEMVLRSLPAAVVPFLNQLKRYKATQEEVKNLQSLELPRSSSDESRGIDLVYYDDLTRIIDECMEAQNPRGKEDVLKEAEEPNDSCKTATSMSENIHWFGPKTLSPIVQNKPLKQTEMNAVASNQPGFLKLGSSLNKTNQPVNINMPIVLISDKKLQLPSPASFLVISQDYRSSLCPVYTTCPTAAVPCVGAELSGRRQSDPARPLVPGKFKLVPQEERLHSSTSFQKKSVKQLLAMKTSQKQAVEQSAVALQIHQAETARKQSVVQPAAEQQLHPAKMSRKQSVEQPITQGKASVCSKSRSDVVLKPESRKTDRKKLGASLRERKVPGVQKIGKNYFTDDDVTLFRERLSETLDEVVQDLRNRLSATNASSAQDVFTNSDLSMHQAQNVRNPSTALIGQKRKRRNTHTSCARTRIAQMETTDDSQMPNSASYREDHLYQFRGRIEEAMDTASDEVMDSAPKHEELVKIPVSGQSAIENPLRPASSSEVQMPEGNVKLEQGDIRMVPTLGSLASKIMKSAGELSDLTVSDKSVVAGPTEESLQTSVLRTVGAGPAKILGRRKSDSDLATQMCVAGHCMSAPPLDTGDFTVDETDDRASRGSVERHFMQAFVPLAGVEEIHRSDEKTVRIKQENEISPKKREQPDIRAARAVQPSSVLRLQDLVKETLITRRISLDAAMFDHVNRERDILLKAVDTSEMRVDDTSGEVNTTTSLALDPEDDPKTKKVFNDSVPEFDIGHGLDFSFQTDKVGFIMPTPVDLLPVKDTSGDQHQSGMCATFSSDSTDTEEHFVSSRAKGESGSDQILGLEISSKEQGSIPGKVSSLIDEDKTGASRETDYADVHGTRLNEKDSCGSKEVGPLTSLQLENNEGNEESTRKEKGLSNEFEDNSHVNISTSSECSASSTRSRLFIDTDLDSSISTADKAVLETVAQECGDELQEALDSIDGDGLEDTVNGNAENDILSCACLEVGLCAEDFESCSEEAQTATNMLEGLNTFEQGQAAGVADSHKESSQVGAIVLEDRITEDCPVNVTGFVNSDDSISPVLHLPDTGLQATMEKIKPVLALQHQPTVVSHEEENSPSSAQSPLLRNRNETTALSTGLSLVSTMEENAACLTQKLPNSHREEQSALSHHQSLISKVEDSSLSIQQPPVRDKEMCLAFSQGPAIRNRNNISTKDQCPKQVTSVTGIKTFREVTEKEVYQIEKAPSPAEDISLEKSPLQQRIDVSGPSNDDMPLDLTKKGVSKRDSVVPKAASHSMFYQSAVDLTVKKQEPSNRQWPGLGSLFNHAYSSDPRFVSSGTGHQQAGSQNACKVNRVGPEVIDAPDCNPAKKCRTMSQEHLTGPSPTDYHPKKVISPQLPLPFSTSYSNSNKQTEMCPEGVNSIPRQPVLNIPRAPYGQWMMQSSGEGFLSNPAGGFPGPAGFVRGSFDAVEQRQNTATSSLGLYSNPTDTGPVFISSHLRNQVRPLQNATYQSFENRFLAQNYIDIVNRQFLAIKAQNEKKVAPGPTRHRNMPSDVMLNAMPQGGSSGDMTNNPVVAAQPKLSNPSHVPSGQVGRAANETGVDVRARLSGVIQARTAGPDLSLRDARNGVTLASATVGLNRHTGPTLPGVNMYPNPSVPSPGTLRSPNFQGVRPELSQMRQRMLHAGPDKQMFPLHPDPMLGMGLNSPFLSNIAGYPHAYPYLYDTRPPSNESMQQRFGSPNLNAAIPGKSPTLQGSGQRISPAVTPEMVMPTNLTIQAWAAHPRNMHGNHQLSPNQMTPLVRFGNPGVGFPLYTCSPQQSRMLTPPVAQKLSERTPLLGTPTSAIRHHVVAAQNYDLLHQDHTESVEQGVLAINPSAPAFESLPEQRSARLVSQIPGNDQHKRDVSSTTFASHSPSSAAVSNVQSPIPSSGYSYRQPVFPMPSPGKNTPVSASSMMINQSPGKHCAVVAASPDRQHLAQIRPDSTASLTPVGGPEQGVHDELLALKRQLEAERQAREQVQLELELYKKHHHKGHKKRKHQTGGEEEEEGQRKRHRSQETDG